MSSRFGSLLHVGTTHHTFSTSSDDESTECVHRGGFQTKKITSSVMPMTIDDMMGDDLWWQMNQEFACSSSCSSSDDEDDDSYRMLAPRKSSLSLRSTPSSPYKKTGSTSNLSEDAWLAMNQDFACEHHGDNSSNNEKIMTESSSVLLATASAEKKSTTPPEELVGDWGVWWE